MFIDISLTEALERLKDPQLLLSCSVVPADYRTQTNPCYREEYTWLFYFERKLFRAVERWLTPYRDEVIGTRGLLSEILSNAYCHGHRREVSLPIEVMVFNGNRGLLLTVEDQGNGFDVDKSRDLIRRGKKHFNLSGNGLQLAAISERFGIFFNQRGNRAALFYLFEETLSAF